MSKILNIFTKNFVALRSAVEFLSFSFPSLFKLADKIRSLNKVQVCVLPWADIT